MSKTILSKLKEGDKFYFVKARRKPQGKIYVVEGQYPLKKITTVFSEDFLKSHKEAEPIAVNDTSEVVLVAPKAYSISHKVTLTISPKNVKITSLKTGDCFKIPGKKYTWHLISENMDKGGNYIARNCKTRKVITVPGTTSVVFPVACECGPKPADTKVSKSGTSKREIWKVIYVRGYIEDPEVQEIFSGSFDGGMNFLREKSENNQTKIEAIKENNSYCVDMSNIGMEYLNYYQLLKK